MRDASPGLKHWFSIPATAVSSPRDRRRRSCSRERVQQNCLFRNIRALNSVLPQKNRRNPSEPRHAFGGARSQSGNRTMKINIHFGGAIARAVARDATDGSGTTSQRWLSNADICGQRPQDRQLRPEVPPACSTVFQLNPNLACKNFSLMVPAPFELRSCWRRHQFPAFRTRI
jgi:hypothetical protein